MKLKHLALLIFGYIIVVQAFSMYLGPEFHSIIVFKFTLFEIGIMLGLMFVGIKMLKWAINFEHNLNNYVIALILLWFIYQLVVVMPIHFYENVYTTKEILYSLFRRSYLLMIPFFYWYVFPAFKNDQTPIRILQISAVILFSFFFADFIMGKTELTSTGENRIAQGVTTTIFVFLLITSFTFFAANKTNFILIFMALVGLVFSNHKTAYLGLAVVFVITLLNSKRIPSSKRSLGHILLIFLLIILPLSQVPGIADNFIGRITSSFGTDDPNAQDRIDHYLMAWESFQENPINGTKVNTTYYQNYQNDRVPPHSFVFQLLTTNGIIGLIFFSSIVAILLAIGYKNRRDPISFQMFLLIIFYLVFTSINENYLDPRNIHMLNFAAALILYRNKCIEDAKEVVVPILIKKLQTDLVLNN